MFALAPHGEGVKTRLSYIDFQKIYIIYVISVIFVLYIVDICFFDIYVNLKIINDLSLETLTGASDLKDL